jgi:ribulose-phosphate 3-epimerase
VFGMVDYRIFGSIMAADLAHLGDDVGELDAAGIDGFHCDVMDGNFVPNITFGADLIKSVRGLTARPFDVHLMVTQPEVLVPGMVAAGANRISIHPEIPGHLQRRLCQIRELGAEPGVALNPATPLESIEWVLDDLDYVLLMTVNPGYSGQVFIPAMRRKIEALAEMIRSHGKRIRILIDGGVDPTNIRELYTLGANDLVSGGGLFYHRPLARRLQEFREAMG